MTPIAEDNGASVYHCDWRGLLDIVPECNALVTDTPYSEKTQGGHDSGVADLERRSINYAAWSPDDVRQFVEAWSPRCRGWFVSITDDTLSGVWRAEFERAGRYAFASLPFVAPGSRVRLSGDGPSAWTCWIIVARPRNREFASWGTLPGAYVLPPGFGGAMPVVGGKPIWLISELVKHYSRAGDLCVDPTCGAGTLAVAAIREGRRAIVGDKSLNHASLAAEWIKNPYRAAPTGKREEIRGQVSLFGDMKL